MSEAEDWQSRYDNIMEDIAKSGSMDDRIQKVNYYKTELGAMRESKLPVNNDLAYLGVSLDQNLCPTPLNHLLNQNPKIAETIKNNEVLDAAINHPDKIKTGEVISGVAQVVGGGTEFLSGGARWQLVLAA